MSSSTLDNPILNRPYDPPERHFALGPAGPTGEIRVGRRPSESFTPIPQAKKKAASGDSVALELDFDFTHERREPNQLINQLRQAVEIWRASDYPRVTPVSRNLLKHWGDPSRENRVLFCQREAAETAIFLTEVAGRGGYRDWRRSLDEANFEHNKGLPRTALKMATGSGKTVVMAMLIAWQTLNKVLAPRDTRFSKQFLVITPGITIRDRLQVLRPSEESNYYDERDLVPADLRPLLSQAQVLITNYHSFLKRDAKEIRGVHSTTRKILMNGKPDPFVETDDGMVARVLRSFGARPKELVVFNDEAHHCYVDRPQSTSGLTLTADEKAANEDARVWFRGLEAVHRKVGVKQIFDLSATPFYLTGSGYNEGFIFPWTASDFSLMDAIESGIVKVPRVPVNDDAQGERVTYLDLWDHVGHLLPKRSTPGTERAGSWSIPKELDGALTSLYRSYEGSFERWKAELAGLGEPPPVMIVVCPNTVVSRLVYEWIGGFDTVDEDRAITHAGHLALLSNVEDGRMIPRPRTILVDSAQLESGDGMKADFKSAAAEEIEAFKTHYRISNPGADVDQITDEDLLREVMNTVGKRGKLGEQVRCVVSVAMLTEGWDANTVTHILGIRAFRSQLLCEQVVGRGLRRRSYALNDDGYFEPEYSNVYGIPFAFIPSDRDIVEKGPGSPAIEVGAVMGREHLRIEFPKLDGYRVEIPDESLEFDADAVGRFVVAKDTVPTIVDLEGIVGTVEHQEIDLAAIRAQRVTFEIAKQLHDSQFSNGGLDPKPWLFPRLVDITRTWLRDCVEYRDGFTVGHLMASSERRHEASESIVNAISQQLGSRRERLRPMMRRHDPTGSTGTVRFVTRKVVREAAKSEVSHVTLDGKDGNTWEHILAAECEANDDVLSYVKNDHLGFTIPYVHKGRSHWYLPDFLVRLRPTDDDPITRTLIVEVSGGQKSPGPTIEKARTARHSWCAAVNNYGGFGRWAYIEITSMIGVERQLADAIDRLYCDEPIIGDPDTLDFDQTPAGEAQRKEAVRGS